MKAVYRYFSGKYILKKADCLYRLKHVEAGMTQQEEFNENSGIFEDSREGGFSIEAFEAFAEKNGIEQAKGYLQAIKDLHPKTVMIARGRIIGKGKGLLKGDAYYISDEEREDKARELLKHIEQFLESAHSLEFLQGHSAKPDQSSIDFRPE